MDDEEMAKRKAQWEREEREPTPLPWRVVRGLQWDDNTELVEICGANEDTVADNEQYYPHAIKAADAELIVRAVNAHDSLMDTIARLRAALAPFAVASDDLDETDLDRWPIWEHSAATEIKIADLRRASAALEESE